MTLLDRVEPVPAGLAAALAAIPERRDFSFSFDLRRAAWITADAIEWTDDDHPGIHRLELAGTLAYGTHLELVSRDRIGVCRSTDAGVELVTIATGGERRDVRRIAALATPRTCLLPRAPETAWQILAVTGFDGSSTLWRIDWATGAMTESGRLPLPVNGGAWLDAGRRLALNLMDPSERSSVYAVDLEAGQFNLLFQASPDSDDRVALYDFDSGRIVVTTDAFGYPAVGVATPGTAEGVRFLPALDSGDEAGTPVAFVERHGRSLILLRHEDGVCARLRVADPETLEISPPLNVPDGEVGLPVATDGSLARFPFSAPDLPWRTARLLLGEDRFLLDAEPADPPGMPPLLPGRATTYASDVGSLPARAIDPNGPSSDLTVIALHGGPIARFGGEFKGELQLFAHLGLPVVALDYPGSTGSGQALMRSLFGRAGFVDVDAVAGVVDAVAAEGRRVILYGESYGAFLALATAAVRPCAGVIAFAPFASFSRLHRYESDKVRELLKLLDQGNPGANGRNLLERCRTIRSKVLMAHGTADKTIPVEESRALAEALRERDGAGENDVHLVELEHQGHELSDRRGLEHWYGEIARFVGDLQAVEIACPTSSPAAGALRRRPREDHQERR